MIRVIKMRKKQSGAVLVISLVMLFSVTIFVLSSSQNMMMQEKMTSAVRDAHVSLQIAESGIVDAENYIETLVNTTGFNSTGAGGLYAQDNGPTDMFADATWTDAKTRSNNTLTGADARYFIEHLGTLYGNVDGFKIVSRSLLVNGSAERIVVSYYGKVL